MNRGQGFTYALVARSNEKGRDILEISLYSAFILSALLAISQFASAGGPASPSRKTSVRQRNRRQHFVVAAQPG